jgi:hypothetical protein
MKYMEIFEENRLGSSVRYTIPCLDCLYKIRGEFQVQLTRNIFIACVSDISIFIPFSWI